MKRFSVLMLADKYDISLYTARCFAQCPDVSLHILSKDVWAPVRFCRYISSYQVISGDTPEQRLQIIAQAIKQTGSHILLPLIEPELRFVFAHRQSLMALTALPPMPERANFDIAINKWSLANFLMSHHIPTPVTVSCEERSNFEQQLHTLSFPVLLKPIHGRAGQHIYAFNHPEELLRFCSEHQDCANRSIVQQFISGYDLTCNVLCQQGHILAYTIQRNIIPGSRKFCPAVGIEFIHDQPTFDLVRALVAALGWNGIAHIDLRYDERDRQVKVIDFNPTYWVPIIGSLVAGVNFPYLACLAGLNIPFPLPEYSARYFIRGKVAITSGIQKIFGRQTIDFTFAETSWKYALQDPFAEIVRLVQRV